MITRIVKMTFIPEQVDTFLKMFDEVKTKIRAVEGCQHLELLSDINQPNVLFTYSYWDDPTFLEKYRHSALFKDVWANTKCHFSEKPEAWSLERKVILE